MKPESYYYPRMEMLRFIPPQSSRLLDVGCGKGRFGAFLKTKMVLEVWGLEIEEDAAKEAESFLDRLIIGSIEDELPKLPEKYFDCIVFNDVLEHMVDPWTVLAEIKKCLAPGGCVVASIPNMRFYEVIKQLLFNKQWRYQEAGIMDIGHLRFFTKESIREMFVNAGYQVELLKGINYEKMPIFYYLLNLFTCNSFGDLRYVQFACVARVKNQV